MFKIEKYQKDVNIIAHVPGKTQSKKRLYEY